MAFFRPFYCETCMLVATRASKKMMFYDFKTLWHS